MTLTLVWPWPQTSQTKLNWYSGSKVSISMRWPWPWSNDLDTQTWPRYGQDVTPYQKRSFYVNCFKSYSLNGHTHTDTMKTLPLPHTWEVIKLSKIAQLFQYFVIIPGLFPGWKMLSHFPGFSVYLGTLWTPVNLRHRTFLWWSI